MIQPPLMQFTLSAAQLWWEAYRVMSLRVMLLSAGGSRAEAEMLRLVPEKMAALLEAQIEMAAGLATGRSHRSPDKVIAAYRRRVRANYRRLRS
jgi:hypothetical protein